MAAPSFNAVAQGYRDCFRTCRATKPKETRVMVDRILANRRQYETVALRFPNQLPWFGIALLHAMEASLSFEAHLHNGDSLRRRTVNVPAGRPVAGTPPFTWAESAYDALRYDGWHKVPAERWQCVEGLLYQMEAFNGWGYRKRQVRTAYLWAASNHEQPGKFVADGIWDPAARSKQIGAAVLLRQLVDLGEVQFAI